VLRAGPCDHVVVGGRGPQRLVVHRLDGLTGERGFGVQTELAADRRRGHSVVTGDHLDRDAGGLALDDRLDRLGSWRVEETDHAGQIEAGQVLEVDTVGVGGDVGAGQREDPLAFGRGVGDALLPVWVAGHPAHVEDPLTCALDEDDRVSVVVVVQRGHEPVLGLERHLVDPGQGRRQLELVETRLER